MVRARLHIICGNCGCNNEWELRVSEELDDEIADKFNTRVTLACNNCHTLHFLDNYIKPEQTGSAK